MLTKMTIPLQIYIVYANSPYIQRTNNNADNNRAMLTKELLFWAGDFAGGFDFNQNPKKEYNGVFVRMLFTYKRRLINFFLSLFFFFFLTQREGQVFVVFDSDPPHTRPLP